MDFVRTVQNLKRPEVSSDIREFVRDNMRQVIALQGQLKLLRLEIDVKLDEVAVQIKLSDLPPLYQVIGPRPYNAYWPENCTLVRYWEVNAPEESNPSVDLRLGPQGWQVVARLRDDSDVADLLAARAIESKPFQPEPRRRLCAEFDYDADPSDVATKVQLVIDALRQPPNELA